MKAATKLERLPYGEDTRLNLAPLFLEYIIERCGLRQITATQPPVLIGILGFPGSGKSALAASLRECLPSVLPQVDFLTCHTDTYHGFSREDITEKIVAAMNAGQADLNFFRGLRNIEQTVDDMNELRQGRSIVREGTYDRRTGRLVGTLALIVQSKPTVIFVEGISVGEAALLPLMDKLIVLNTDRQICRERCGLRNEAASTPERRLLYRQLEAMVEEQMRGLMGRRDVIELEEF